MAFLRYIWIAIRGINYTDRATRQVGRNIDILIRKQQELRRASVALIAGGLMWTAMAAMATLAIYKIMEASAEGRRLMRTFGRATERLLRGLGTAFVRVLGPSIMMLTNLFNALARHPEILNLITVLTVLGLTMLTIRGMSMVMTGSFDMVMMSMVNMGIITVGTSNTMAAAFVRLQAAMGPIIMGFMLGVQLATMLGERAWVLVPVIGALTIAFALLAVKMWSVAAAWSVITFGAAALAGVAAMVALQAQMPTYQMGTRLVQHTTPAIVHAGETISGTTGQIQQQVQPVTRRSQWNVTVNMSGPIYTRADKDNLHEEVRRALKEELDNKV